MEARPLAATMRFIVSRLALPSVDSLLPCLQHHSQAPTQIWIFPLNSLFDDADNILRALASFFFCFDLVWFCGAKACQSPTATITA